MIGFKRVLDYCLPILFFCGVVYLVMMVLSWTAVIPVDVKDSKIILGYISLIHVLVIPVFQFGMRRQYTSFYLLFLIINTLWVSLVAVALGLIYGGVLGSESMTTFRQSSIHVSFFYCYLTVSVVSLVAVFILTWKTQRSFIYKSFATSPIEALTERSSHAKTATTTTKNIVIP